MPELGNAPSEIEVRPHGPFSYQEMFPTWAPNSAWPDAQAFSKLCPAGN